MTFTSYQQTATVYGPLTIDDPLVHELIESAPFQRLKGINQYGVVNFIVPTESYTRFDHSLGVYHLLKKHGLSKEEQIAGLLHDVSHTVFSHVGDYVFKEKYPGGSYQDDIHLWYLEESGLAKILQKHGLSKESIDHKCPRFQALDQPLPYLCADRIEYNLQGGYLRNLLTKKDFDEIANALSWDSTRWLIQSEDAALKLAYSSLIMTETLWGAPWEALSYHLTAECLRKSFEISLVTFDEFHFSTDTLIWNKLLSSKDPYISNRMGKIKNIHACYTLTEHGDGDIIVKPKFSGINPLVATEKGIFPLTFINEQYAQEFERVKTVLRPGWALKLIS